MIPSYFKIKILVIATYTIVTGAQQRVKTTTILPCRSPLVRYQFCSWPTRWTIGMQSALSRSLWLWGLTNSLTSLGIFAPAMLSLEKDSMKVSIGSLFALKKILRTLKPKEFYVTFDLNFIFLKICFMLQCFSIISPLVCSMKASKCYMNRLLLRAIL